MNSIANIGSNDDTVLDASPSPLVFPFSKFNSARDLSLEHETRTSEVKCQ